MKKVVYEAVVRFTVLNIWIVDQIFGITIALAVWLGASLRTGIARIGHFFMTLIDKERTESVEHEHALEDGEEGSSDIKKQDLELRLLNSASQVKEHAIANGDWTDHHSEAINAIGDALMNECDWQEDNVHFYLREIVESIPGLEYHEGDD